MAEVFVANVADFPDGEQRIVQHGPARDRRVSLGRAVLRLFQFLGWRPSHRCLASRKLGQQEQRRAAADLLQFCANKISEGTPWQ